MAVLNANCLSFIYNNHSIIKKAVENVNIIKVMCEVSVAYLVLYRKTI